MKIFIAQQIYMLLSPAKLTGLSLEEKYKVITLARVFKKVAQEFEDFIKDSQENISDKVELNSIIEKEATQEVDINYDKLGEVFDKLISSNDWNVAQILMLEEYIK